MRPIAAVLRAHWRSNACLLLGVCLGLSLSLLLAPGRPAGPAGPAGPTGPGAPPAEPGPDEYEPRISRPAEPARRAAPKVFVRPRYYSTELGIREKLFVGVLSSPEHLHSRGVAANRSVAHLVDKLRFFVSLAEGAKPNVSLPGIVGFTDARSILRPFHALKYITDNYLEDFDYYFLVKDTSYVNARRLAELVAGVSVSQDVHLGAASEDGRYCSLDAGVLLSNSLLKRIRANLDYCVKVTFSSSDDVNFGRCVLHSTSLACAAAAQGQAFSATRLNVTFDYQGDFEELSRDRGFQNSVTVFPIYDHLLVYKLNKYFAQVELVKVEKEIETLRAQILKTANFTPDNDVVWPIGSQPEFKTTNRFDVLRWTYFNMSHSFLDDDFGVVEELDASQKEEVQQVVSETVARLLKSSGRKLKFHKLVNGYWKFDNSRGVDYLLDLSFVTDSGKKISRRIQACKPLGKVEILPAPYVTENSRINMLVTVDSQRVKECLAFLAHYADTCMDRKDKVSLTMVLLYNPGYASKGSDDVFHEIKQRALFLTQKYKKDQLKVTWLSIRLPTIYTFVEIEPLLKIAIADLYIKKLTSDNLILFADTRMEIKIEYLNRVRMNTISQWQVFSPIPFVQYHPDIIRYDEKKHVEFDIIHSHGRYDEFNYDSVSFYAKDYMTVRKSIENRVPLARTDKDIASILKLSQSASVGSIFEMFVEHSKLNTFRAVEPALKLRYRDISCIGTRNNVTLDTCLKRRSLQLGNRGQLARLILDYQEQHH